MKKTIGCLHAHHSNIAYIENSMASDELEFVHFVDPGLMRRIASDSSFDDTKAKNKVIEQIEWISSVHMDAILITCTNYIALLEENRLHSPIPIIKIDEPFFRSVCTITEPQILLFTNPATVEGTMQRLYDFASAIGKPIPHVEARVIENTFELIMQGKKERYAEEVSKYIQKVLASEPGKFISVAQLSMAESAERLEREFKVKIGNPLNTLIAHFASLFR